eukprot:TRINITY_DN1338_c0_g1_i7.p3 TRINITY_DN1338_c0_g1~~TRINITY_DN1338_c0_g1_i7.p3  ORF type:complete len:276 (-),score=112.00 TRINITY_DN1338_c0_g1_i7:107-934(-)
MDSLVYFIDSLVRSNGSEPQDAKEEGKWTEEMQRLSSLYKIDLLTLQNKYRDALREVCATYIHRNLSSIYSCLTTVNAHERPIDEESEDILEEIAAKAVFNDPAYDLKGIITREFDITRVPEVDKELMVQLLDKVREYKEHILEKLDEAYERVKFRLESYYRNLIKRRKAQLASSIGTAGEVSPAAALTQITNEHHKALLATREQYESKMTRIEQDHQFILKQLMSLPGEEERLLLQEGNAKNIVLVKQKAIESGRFAVKVCPGKKIKGENRLGL